MGDFLTVSTKPAYAPQSLAWLGRVRSTSDQDYIQVQQGSPFQARIVYPRTPSSFALLELHPMHKVSLYPLLLPNIVSIMHMSKLA